MKIKVLFKILKKIYKNNQIYELLIKIKNDYLPHPRNFLTLYHRILNEYNDQSLQSSYSYLAYYKHKQVKNYNQLKYKFNDYYNEIKNYNFDSFMVDHWKNVYKRFQESFSDYPPFSFLRNPDLKSTMFVKKGGKWLKFQLKYLEKKISKKQLKTILLEDYIGNPILSNSKYNTSHNSIHHLYHLIRFFNKTKCNIDNINSVIEWGGGYGNLAKIFLRHKLKPITYIIIDLPIFSCIQWLYLATIFGEKHINLIHNSTVPIISEKINILPVSFTEKYQLKADLFISTWALTESSKYSQDYVLKSNWFSSKHFLLAYANNNKKFPLSEKIKKFFINNKFYIEDLKFIPNIGNRYAFK
ncbi:MAG: putative sugar O-methyltransferase [Candidatus Hodarchaeota archaeon]